MSERISVAEIEALAAEMGGYTGLSAVTIQRIFIVCDLAQEALAQRNKLRDKFAGQALQGLFASNQHGRVICTADAKQWADYAYVYADAMLAARKLTEGE